MTDSGVVASGYVSINSKRKFTLTAGILGAAFLITQVVLPIAVMFGFMASDFADFDFDARYVDPQKSAVWNGTLFYVAGQREFHGGNNSPVIMAIDVELTSPPRVIAHLNDDKASLFQGRDRLWILSSDEISFLEGDDLVSVTHGQDLAEFSQPFLYEDRPAVLERWPASLVLVTFDQGEWIRGPGLELIMPDPECSCDFRWARALGDGQRLDVFVHLGSTLYHGSWDPTSLESVDWNLVGDAGESWWPTRLHDGVSVHTLEIESPPRLGAATIIGRRLSDNGWNEVFRQDGVDGREIAVHQVGATDRQLVLAGHEFGDSMNALVVDGGKAVNERVLGDLSTEPSRSPAQSFERSMFVIMGTQYSAMFLLPLLLAVILSALMRRHRIGTFRHESAEALHASITRRAIAQFIDSLLLFAPAIAGGYFLSSSMWMIDWNTADGFWEGAAALLPLILGGAVSLLGFVVFVITEGRWGVTPGKWVTGIRVLGTDLRPCGVLRALVRNLLKTIDGFFNFMVGIMVVALSDNWQRVGDLAARTVVVRVRSGDDPHTRLRA